MRPASEKDAGLAVIFITMSDSPHPDIDHARRLISLVVPCFNEESCIETFLEQINEIFMHIPDCCLEYVFINDGSTDGTLEILKNCQRKDKRICIIDLSRNFGKENALSAGLDQARGDAMIPMDVDLQDPPQLIEEMIAKWREGWDVVVAHRADRDQDSWMKRTSARYFYKVHNVFSQQKLPENVGDYRLMDRKVVEALRLMPENCRFMKGLFSWLGFRTTSIDYIRQKRAAGKSKFNTWKLWNFALEGLTSFSTVPLRIWTYIGAFFSLISFLYGAVIFWRTVFFGVDLPGYASIIVVMTFFGGLQLMGIGILGEYLGRTYLEAKRRPVYIIRKIYRMDDSTAKRSGGSVVGPGDSC